MSLLLEYKTGWQMVLVLLPASTSFESDSAMVGVNVSHDLQR